MTLRYTLIVFLFAPCAIAVPDLTATTANAACGDWAVHRDGPVGPITVGGGSGIKSESARSTASVFGTLRHGSAPAPCHGPFCRSAPNLPAPLTPVTLPRIDWVLLGVLQRAMDGSMAESYWTIVEHCAHPTEGFPADIEHPPRV
jgi:hypothetical protein